MKLKSLALLCFFCSHYAASQDTASVLTLADLFRQIVEYHPVARQANLLSENAKQEIRFARGSFDPELSSKYLNKSFKGNNYFDLWDSYFRVPIWYGTDLKFGYERNSGPNINPEDYTPSSGLSYAGISVPLGQGLIIDERRATLRQAQLLINLAEAEKVKIINKLLLQTAKDYWDWVVNYKKWELYNQGYEFARFRLEAVKKRIEFGDLAGIDSVEARIQLQNFESLVQQSQVDYQNSILILSNYLWNEDLAPVELTSRVVPSLKGSEIAALREDSVKILTQAALENHPDLVKLNTKLKQLEIEQLFVKDKLKPKLNLEYNLLQQNFPFKGENFTSGYLSDNYKFGISFSQPIFLRRERSKLQLTKLKIADTNFSFAATNREIATSIHIAYNECITLENQIKLQQEAVKNYEILRTGEQQRFANGESSLFLVNQRDLSLINSQIKLYEMKAKYAKNKILLQWSAGRIEF